MRKLWLGLALTCLLMGAACAQSSSDPTGAGPSPNDSPAGEAKATPNGNGGEKKPPASGEPVENPAPDFEVTTFDGEEFALREQRGTPVVLNFWESW
jgi:hypothetical protein